MRNNFKYVLVALSLILSLTAIGFAQRTTGDLEGTVKDQAGAVVPGAEVTVTGINIGFNRKVQSDNNGVYRLSQIPAGAYKVTVASIKGFAASTLDSVTVNIEQTTTADVSMTASASINTVDVTNDPIGVNVDSTDSKVQTNITDRLIDALPKGQNFTSLLKVSPGTRAEPLSGGFQVDGASGSENSFVIDGQELSNFRTGTLNTNNNIPTTLVQEIQVKTSGFEAEHGGASGGVITVQTKSGSDDFHGEFGTIMEDSKLQPGNRFATQVFQASGTSPQFVYGIKAPKSSYNFTYPTASFSGPIIKKRVWFLGNYSPQFFPLTRTTTFYDSLGAGSFPGTSTNGGITSGVNLTQSTTFPAATYHNEVKNEYAFGRIDAAIFNNLRFAGTYLWNPTITRGIVPYDTISVGGSPNNARLYGGQIYQDVDFQRLGGGRTNSNNFTSQLVYTPTSKLVVTGRYAHGFLNEKGATAYGIPSGDRFVCSGLSAAYATINTGCPRLFDTGANSLATRDVSIKNEFNFDAAYLVNHLVGRHEFKGGYQYGTTKNDVLSGFPKDGQIVLQYGRNFDFYGLPFLTANCNLRTAANPNGNCVGIGRETRFGTSGIASNKYQGIYVQDKWQATNRLTLNLGVRLEKENLPAFDVTNGRGGIPISFGFGKKVAPRLGGAYDIFGDGKSRIFASYGLFYDRLKFALPRGSFGGDFFRRDYFPILATGTTYNSFTTARILGNFKDPIGGGNPSTQGGLSIFQVDFRIPSNLPASTFTALGLPFSGTAPDLKPFRQREYTVGYEQELSREYVISARFTNKLVRTAIEDHATIGINDSENYVIGNPGEGFDITLDKQAGYVKSLRPLRSYRGLEITLNKRLSHNYFFNANYTFSRLFGNYSGLASSDENGRTDPGVSRYFDYIVNGFTFNGNPDDGNLPTDRHHAFKAYGGYDFDWFKSKTNTTEISFFQQILQGTPQTTYIGIENSSIVFDRRGDLGRTPTFLQTDVSLSHRYRFGRDTRYSIVGEINVLNIFNNNSVLSLDTNRYAQFNGIGFSDVDPTYNPTTQPPTKALNTILNGGFKPAQVDAVLNITGNPRNVHYGQPTSYQGVRNVRFGFRFIF